MLNRRQIMTAATGLAVAGLAPGRASAGRLTGIDTASMRGAIDAAQTTPMPGTLDDQSRAFAKMLREASERDKPVFLPAGTYVVSNLSLPPRVRLMAACPCGGRTDTLPPRPMASAPSSRCRATTSVRSASTPLSSIGHSRAAAASDPSSLAPMDR